MSRFVILGCGIVLASEEQRGALFLSFHLLEVMGVRDPFARQFYSSGAWADCREAYRTSIGNLCEICLKNGQINPVDEVHHKIRLTPQNINDPKVTLNWKNLEGLCERCHKLAHKRKRRYNVDESGRLSILDGPLG